MKRKQITAILLSAIMTVTACMPMNSISAVAAETSGAGNTETAAVVEMQEEEAPAEEAEPGTAVAAQEVQEEQTVEAEPAAEPEESGEEATEAEPAVEEAVEEAEKAEAVVEDASEEEAAVQVEEPAAEEETAEPAAVEVPAAETVEEEAAEPKDEADQKADTSKEEAVVEETKEQEKAKTAKKAADPTPEDFENATPLEIGTPITVSLSPENQDAYFKFIPAESATYEFKSDSEFFVDNYGYLYDSNYEEIQSDDDSAYSGQFLIKYDLEAGETYYLRARMYNSEGESGTFNVVVRV